MPNPPSDPANAPETPKITPDKSIEGGKISQPDTSSFESYKEQAPGAITPGTSSEISPMDLASKAGISTTPTFQTLLSQANNAQDSLGTVQQNLKTPNLKFRSTLRTPIVRPLRTRGTANNVSS